MPDASLGILSHSNLFANFLIQTATPAQGQLDRHAQLSGEHPEVQLNLDPFHFPFVALGSTRMTSHWNEEWQTSQLPTSHLAHFRLRPNSPIPHGGRSSRTPVTWRPASCSSTSWTPWRPRAAAAATRAASWTAWSRSWSPSWTPCPPRQRGVGGWGAGLAAGGGVV